MKLADVLAVRLVAQRLAGPPAPDPVDAVRESLCVQSQDAPLAMASLALRSDCHTDAVAAGVDAGAIVRAHVLRPTWHYVAAEDLAWLQARTGPKVERSLASRHRQLGLDEARREAGVGVVADALAGGRHLTRAALGEELLRAGVVDRQPLLGQQVGHVLLVAEVRGVICSGRLERGVHAYALADEWLPAAPDRDAEAAAAELVGRFVASHGPVSVRDLQRWTPFTRTEIGRALASLGDGVACVEVDGATLWYDARVLDERGPGSPGWPDAVRAARGAFVLSVFDEAFLTYSQAGWPRYPGHPRGGDPVGFAESGGGPVLDGLADVGSWRRSHTARGFTLRLSLASGLPDAARRRIRRAADDLAARCVAPGTPVTIEGA